MITTIILFLFVFFISSSLSAFEFEDVEEDHWAHDAVYDLVELGVLSGFPDGSFRGQEELNRYQLAIIISQAMDVMQEDTVSQEEHQQAVKLIEDLRQEFEAELYLIEQLEERLSLLEAESAPGEEEVMDIFYSLFEVEAETLITEILQQEQELEVLYYSLQEALQRIDLLEEELELAGERMEELEAVEVYEQEELEEDTVEPDEEPRRMERIEKETAGQIGFEFGSNIFIPIDSDRDSGFSRVFLLNFQLSEQLATGYYYEEGRVDVFDLVINALQVENRINDLLSVGVRFGRSNSDIYGAIYTSLIPLRRDSTYLSGDLKINLGFDFMPENNLESLKFGLGSRITF